MKHANVVREKWLKQSRDVETGAQRIAQQCQHKDDIALNAGKRPAEKRAQHAPGRNPPC